MARQFDTPKELAAALREKLDISNSYASELAHEKRQPSMSMALRIYQALGVQLGPIRTATRAEIAALTRVTARAESAAA